MGLFRDREREKELERDKEKYEARSRELALKLFALRFKLIAIVLVIVLVIVGIVIWRVSVNKKSGTLENVENVLTDAIIGQEGEVTTITETSLQKVFEISEVSTADYTYNAIACKYEGEEQTPKYYVAYMGTVKAGIDFSKIEFQIYEDSKRILVKLPECEIQSTTVDFGSMEYIFKDKKYETETVSQEAYKLCQEDLAARVKEEKEFLRLAQENAKAVVEALVFPWIQQLDAEYVVEIR